MFNFIFLDKDFMESTIMSLIQLSCVPLGSFSSPVTELRLRVLVSGKTGSPHSTLSLLLTVAIKFRQNTWSSYLRALK